MIREQPHVQKNKQKKTHTHLEEQVDWALENKGDASDINTHARAAVLLEPVLSRLSTWSVHRRWHHLDSPSRTISSVTR
eukprot:m.364346 g.364346  ORF g.364346 m.364346 type:complete len:79 (+) comp19968_c0_seq10:1371-1607(+)